MEFSKEIVPDFQLGDSICALYLSVRYHLLHREYIFERIKPLRRMHRLRLVLCHVDTNECTEPLAEITQLCMFNEFVLILAWSYKEVARYLETFKAYENKAATLIQEKVEEKQASKIDHILRTVRGINRTDVATLITNFGSFRSMIEASPEELTICPGMGETKVRRLYSAFHEPFFHQQPQKKPRVQMEIDKMLKRTTSTSSSSSDETHQHELSNNGGNNNHTELFFDEEDAHDDFGDEPNEFN